MYCLKNAPRSIVICYIFWNCTLLFTRIWFTQIMEAVSGRKFSESSLKQRHTWYLWWNTTCSFHFGSFPLHAPIQKRHRISRWQKNQKLVVFLFNLPQTSRPWTFWSSTWIDSNKASWKTWGSVETTTISRCRGEFAWWRVEEPHQKCLYISIHQSVHPFINPCVICFEGPNVNLHILPLHVEERYTQHSYYLRCIHFLSFTWQFFCVAAVRWCFIEDFPCKNMTFKIFSSSPNQPGSFRVDFSSRFFHRDV